MPTRSVRFSTTAVALLLFVARIAGAQAPVYAPHVNIDVGCNRPGDWCGSQLGAAPYPTAATVDSKGRVDCPSCFSSFSA